ncbi:Crp/Fnr family transcriptional regulator [Bacillus sp. AGMB 02131]|uniref:Crp/Fnr family transcriptional regulator n=1 Tax=Peribacillus faecalis TaxID=2772559 RepID=A0A927CY44_9BACI|nr:Crp/Fnr family transcriptional regulator [Peribacillus faecalis]MBD3109181.1 Crp/Fnr family transcriptional regulator [Peribacillus faecalis]
MQDLKKKQMILSYLQKYELEQIFEPIGIEQFELLQLPKGHVLCAKGDEINEMYLLVEGKLKIYTTTLDDKRLILRFQEAMGMIGDIEFIQATPVLYTIETSTDCTVIRLPYAVLRQKASQEPQFLTFLLKVVTNKFRAKTDAASLNLLYPVEVRLASYLLSTKADNERLLYHEEAKDSSMNDIADMVGTSYRHLNRVIKKLCNDGVIERIGGKLFIKDIEKLREIAKNNIYE